MTEPDRPLASERKGRPLPPLPGRISRRSASGRRQRHRSSGRLRTAAVLRSGGRQRIAGNGPLAVAAAHQVVRASAEDMVKARDLWAELVPKVFSSEDAKEGARAFVERRLPNWTAT